MIVIYLFAMYSFMNDRRLPIRKLIQTLVSKMTLTFLSLIYLLPYNFNFLVYCFQTQLFASEYF